MHKSMDLGYHIPETSIACYPSLMSPLSTFDQYKSPSKSKGIFDRLQADTELRLRARINSVSASRIIREKPSVPIEEKLIRKGKEREVRLRHLIEQEELKRVIEMQDRPFVSPNSKAIMKNKYFNSERISKSLKFEGQSEEKEKVEEGLGEEKQDKGGIDENIKEVVDRPHVHLRNYQKQLIRQLEISYKMLSEKRKPKSKPLEVKCVDRKYVPMFGKQGNWGSLLSKNGVERNSSGLSKMNQDLVGKKSGNRPASMLIADSAVGFTEALAYQQIIRNRIVNSSNVCTKSYKRF